MMRELLGGCSWLTAERRQKYWRENFSRHFASPNSLCTSTTQNAQGDVKAGGDGKPLLAERKRGRGGGGRRRLAAGSALYVGGRRASAATKLDVSMLFGGSPWRWRTLLPGR